VWFSHARTFCDRVTASHSCSCVLLYPAVKPPSPLMYLLVLFSVKHTDHFGFIYCAGGRSRTYNFNHHWHQITKYGSIQPSSTFLSLSCLIFVLPFCCRFFAGKDLLSFSGLVFTSEYFYCSVLSLSGTFPHYHKPTFHLHTRVLLA